MPPSQPEINFQLPKLQGKTIDEHFYKLGIEESEPWLTLAEDLAFAPTLPLPSTFAHVSGWTRYDPVDCSHTPVPYPEGETMLTFDVEVLYKIHPYPVMAAACSPTHWYTWISPWLLSESTSQEHLVPLGPPEIPKVIVGHNVGYDRGRIKEEYSLALSQNRFLDTMSFHVATQGVSGPQRGAWMAYWKDHRMSEKQRKANEKALLAEMEIIKSKLENGETTYTVEVVEERKETDPEEGEKDTRSAFTSSNVVEQVLTKTVNLVDKLAELEDQLENLPPAQVIDGGKKRRVALDKFGDAVVAEPAFDSEIRAESSSITSQAETASRMWEDITATNSLDEVFKLHYHGSELDKSARDAFSAENPYEVRQDLDNLLRYCASDVLATHRVYKKVFPRFRRVCPSPVSFAGQLKMGSAFLPIDKGWDDYVERSESLYVKLNVGVRQKLATLAEDARRRFVEPPVDWTLPAKDTYARADLECPDELREDPWLSQLDWTPKKARWIGWKTKEHLGMSTVKTKADEGSLMPVNWTDLSKSKIVPPLLGLKWRGYPFVWSVEHGWVYRVDAEDRASKLFEEDSHLPPVAFNRSDDQALKIQSDGTGGTTTFHAVPLGPRQSAMKISGWLAKSFVKKPAARGSLSCDDPRVLDMARTEDWEGLKVLVREVLEKKGLMERKEEGGARTFASSGAPGTTASVGSTPFPDSGSSYSSPTPALDVNDPDWEPSDDFYLQPVPDALKAHWWPTWYSNLFSPRTGYPRDFMNVSVKVTLAVSLLRLTWLGHPLFKSRQFGWVYRVPVDELTQDEREGSETLDAKGEKVMGEKKVLSFSEGAIASAELKLLTEEDAARKKEETKLQRVDQRRRKKLAAEEEELDEDEADERSSSATKKKTVSSTPAKKHPDIALHLITEGKKHAFLKVPHPKGATARVGSMITKASVKDFEANILSSEFRLAREAIEMNAQCSYWVSVRSRIFEQMVVRETEELPMGFNFGRRAETPSPSSSSLSYSSAITTSSTPRECQGLILPQVVVMGTITRRAIEKTWLTASNAKKNRVGSELKAMVKAPEGYSIVGADVDSEELWIAGLMGDAQIGLHGGSAIGWMTLEGTKAAGTDVHSKTASITGTSRDAAKVFNYSRIYGAGVKHATQLLMDAMQPPDAVIAEGKARDLYVATKGNKMSKNNNFHNFWHGGTESYLFNAMEQVARSSRPRTPALACGITAALQEDYLQQATDHMTSRINWAVQSSGVDYLHLLIVATDYLCRRYDIDARYLISVHDEVRYLVKNEDRIRATLAMQIANLWTRSQFAFKLGMEDLPQGVGFFSAVDVDFVLRKEVFMECVTPSNPFPIPPGEVLDIHQTLERTGGTLHRDGRPMEPTLGNLFNTNNLPSPHLSITPPPFPPSSLTIPASIKIPTRERPYVAPPSFRTGKDEQWKRFFLKAQAMPDQKQIEELWQKSRKPSDPFRTLYSERFIANLTRRNAREKEAKEAGQEEKRGQQQEEGAR